MSVRTGVRPALRGGVRAAAGARGRDEPNVPPSPDWVEIAPLYVAYAGRFDIAMNKLWPAVPEWQLIAMEFDLLAPQFVEYSGQFDMAMNSSWPAR